MKKFLVIFASVLTFALNANAQTAIETSKALDNISVGVTVGATTPLDFNSVFPLNTVAGLRLQKDFTPAIGIQVEGLAFLNSNNNIFISPAKTTVKATNVGLNGVVNLSNAFNGYQGSPRTFEVSAVAGVNWIHEWETKANFLGAKTGLDLAYNFGSTKAHSIIVTPAIFWNLNKLNHMQFNKHLSQLGITATYVFHFKTSNGTRHFKSYDIGAMIGEIDRLNDEVNGLVEMNKALQKVIEEKEGDNTTKSIGGENTEDNKTVGDIMVHERVKTNTIGSGEWIVMFAQGSAELTEDAKERLNTIPEGLTVIIKATSSPEGSAKRNMQVSEERAKAVADFLKNKKVNVKEAVGLGCTGAASNRVAIVKIAD